MFVPKHPQLNDRRSASARENNSAVVVSDKLLLSLSPDVIGPITVYPGMVPRESRIHANGYLHCGVYHDQVDDQNRPTREHARWMLAGFGSDEISPVARSSVPLYYIWRNRRLGHVEARLRVYIPTYVEGICRSSTAMDALTTLRALATCTTSPTLSIDKAMRCQTFAQEFADPMKEIDYILVLAALLKNKLHGAIHEIAIQLDIEPLAAYELPPNLSPFDASEGLPNLAGGAIVLYRKNFLGLMADRYLKLFMPGGAANIPWRRGTIIRFGRECKEGHDTAHFGDVGTAYEYAGKDHTPLHWDCDLSGALRELLGIVKFVTGKPINFCLMNFYELRDSIGVHSDHEDDLVPDVGVFSISLGYPRLFEMRSKSEAVRGAPVAIRLQHGSALWMMGRTQKTHYHWIDAEKGKPLSGEPMLARVNLTFRAVRIRSLCH